MKKREIFLLIGIIVGVILLIMSVVLISKFAPDTINHRWFNRGTGNSESITTTDTDDSKSDNILTPERAPSFDEDNQSKENVNLDNPNNKKPNTNENLSSDKNSLESDKSSNNSKDDSSDNSKDNSSESTPSQDGLSKNTAWNIETNMEYTATMLQSNQTHWFSFVTSSEDVIHRIYFDPTVNENHAYASWYIYIYNENGILLYENSTSSYVEKYFFDAFLSANSKYYIKISAIGFYKEMDNYMLAIEEIPRDPATVSNKENAVVIGTEITYTGYLNTTFSNWYTCTFLEGGTYMMEIHNIDTGDTLSYVGTTPGGNGVLTGIVYDGNNDSKRFNVTSGQQIYLEIDSHIRNVNGKYMFIIKKVA